MLRIDKRNIRFNTVGYLALDSIYGIGSRTSAQIWNCLGVHPGYFISDSKLDTEHPIFTSMTTLFSIIEHFLGLSFRRQNKSDLEILKKIRAYRGIRYFFGLPIRGQRRHTNARTARNSRFRSSNYSKAIASKKLKNYNYRSK